MKNLPPLPATPPETWAEERVRILAHLNRMIAEGVSPDLIWINYREYAALRNTTEATIRGEVHTRKLSVPIYRHGRAVRFRLSDVLASLAAAAG